MNGVETQRLRPLTGFGPLFGWGLARTWRTKKLMFGGGLALLLGLAIGASTSMSGDPVWSLYEALDTTLGIFLPLVALGLVGGGFGEEVAEQTLVYHLVRPIRRSTIYIARFVAGLVPGAVVGAAIPVVMAAANGSPIGTPAVVALAATGAVGVTTLGAVFYALAALFRRGLVAGLVYAFLLEGMFQFLPGSMQKLSLMHHVKSLGHAWTDDAFAALSTHVRSRIAAQAAPPPPRGDLFAAAAPEPWTSPTTAIAVCLAVVLLALFLGARAVERRDFALKE